MQKFLLKLLTVSILIISSLIFLEYQLAQIPNSYTLKKDCIENNLSQVDILILGSSQAYWSINPQPLSPHPCNLANSNQDLYYDYKLLDKYIDKLSHLKLVIISVSYFSLEFRLQNTDESWRKYFYQHFYDIPTNDNIFNIKNYSLIADYTPEKALEIIINKNDPSFKKITPQG